MLQLKNITKVYKIGKPKDKDYQETHALKDVSINFRKNEFVSILGPSGCGKTTMLNIIGGLDKYTSGDLIIDGKSTKQYQDKDWDNYRNNCIGFVFQSYNLIPHQTILENVELALTLSGVKKAERREKAKLALAKVGLGDRINAKPNQLSGGQMQRVAIARALVNDPEIILADEPTGALDTKTSIQVMELLKEVAKERLVIMVTHNPELAEEYSTRIIKMLDGEKAGDTNPVQEDELNKLQTELKQKAEAAEVEEQKLKTLTKSELKEYKKSHKGKKHTKRMSFFTALSLSLKNLLTKKTRTMLVSFAGSIGIIGIALILSLSSGFQNYIDRVQKDTLSTYPITISRTSTDYTKMMETMMGDTTKDNIDTNKVYSNNSLSQMFGMLTSGSTTNDLVSFKKYLDREDISAKLKDIATIKYTYDLDLNIFYNGAAVGITDTSKLLQVSPFNIMSEMMSVSGMFGSFLSDIFEEMLDNPTLLNNQYNLVKGKWANDKVYYDAELGQNVAEIVVVLDKNNAISDYALMALGLRDRSDISKLLMNANADDLSSNFDMSIDDLLNLSYSLVLNPNMYQKDDGTGLYNYQITDLNANSATSAYYSVNVADKEYVKANTSVTLKVVGVIKPNPDASATSITGAIGYTKGLTDFCLNKLAELAKTEGNALYDQLHNSQSSVITGKLFAKTAMELFELYAPSISDPNLAEDKRTALTEFGKALQQIGAAGTNLQSAFNEPNTKPDELYKKLITNPAGWQSDSTKAAAVLTYKTAVDNFQAKSDNLTDAYKEEMDIVSRDDTLKTLGNVDKANPASISFYAVNFEAKNGIESIIKDYNNMVLADESLGNQEEREKFVISYTDYVGLMMNSISVIINAITYVLIAFVSISLIVSSIMIGIITYISVLERTKEIGVLRSVGASKRDIKRVFTAESLIIGFTAGMLGIVITLILTIPVNIVINSLAGIAHVASLPWVGALILVAISMLLTFIAGLLPANIASKKDPVVALRTE